MSIQKWNLLQGYALRLDHYLPTQSPEAEVFTSFSPLDGGPLLNSRVPKGPYGRAPKGPFGRAPKGPILAIWGGGKGLVGWKYKTESGIVGLKDGWGSKGWIIGMKGQGREGQ